MLTRPAHARDGIAQALKAAGTHVDVVPLIRIVPPGDEAALHSAAAAADMADWIVFTSANGVTAFAAARREPLGARAQVAAIGPATAAAVESSLGRRAALVPKTAVAEALADALIAAGPPQAQVAVFQAQDARPVLAERLRAAGFSVVATSAYATLEADPANIADRVRAADAIVLTSGSSARALVRGLARGSDAQGLASGAARALAGKLVVCLGAITAQEAQRCGIVVSATAKNATAAGVLDALQLALAR